jgi:hypothetical protein
MNLFEYNIYSIKINNQSIFKAKHFNNLCNFAKNVFLIFHSY